ncbi:MAG TPA: acyl-CoA dehydrogenase family protein [Mycobacteriales bacterium]|nr:acyl-CoA dehydrogenase family protein [Mycobacteriales bacterium]
MVTHFEGDAEAALVRDRLATLVGDLQRRPHSPSEAWGATFDAGLSRVSYPLGWGGLDVRPELQAVVDEELERIGVPDNFSEQAGGIGVVAPALAKFGSDAQREKYLRRLFTCDEFWCQLFSEPGAGSDLASLRTSAVRDGDSWTVNGGKVWTTMAHIARRGLLLARTSSDKPRHNGITAFIVDMTSPGVEVRPLRQMTGDAEFNEVFLTDVVVPDTDRIGEVDDGWRIALGTLMEERNATNHVLDHRSASIDEALEVWRSLPAERRTATHRAQLMDLYVRWHANEFMRARGVARQRLGIPGPEGSLVKLAWGDLTQAVYELCIAMIGAEGMLYGSYEMHRPTSWHDIGIQSGDIPRAFLRSRAQTIEGGTNEVQRNTIAERILALPREPRA